MLTSIKAEKHAPDNGLQHVLCIRSIRLRVVPGHYFRHQERYSGIMFGYGM